MTRMAGDVLPESMLGTARSVLSGRQLAGGDAESETVARVVAMAASMGAGVAGALA